MLLDTPTLLWFLSDDENLPSSVKQQIEATDTVFASIVSLWEIAIKLSINKLTLRTPFESLDSDIAAQTIRHSLVLVSRDTILDAYPIQRLRS